jgi:aminoglycoside phosphotransferase (APT) family kinase protein
MTGAGVFQQQSNRADGAGNALEKIVRKQLGLSADETVSLEEISRHTNLNHVYKAHFANQSIYLKVVPERPKRLPISLPRERVFSEAEAIRIFRDHASGEVLVPDVLFVDKEEFVLGMTDVGQGRQVLLDLLDDHYSLFVMHAAALGRALGAVHSATTGMPQFRRPEHDRVLRTVVFQGLIAPGAKAAFPDLADRVIEEMGRRSECFVHADLWGKNILIGEEVPPAIVDFEGAFVGDAAFDVATVLATATLPIVDRPSLRSECEEFTAEFLSCYRQAYASDHIADERITRAFYYVGTLIAARGFGPFAYPMSNETRTRIATLARNLTEFPPSSPAQYTVQLAG